VTVELKNDIQIRGTLKSVDQYLNIKLDDIQVVEELKYPHMVRLFLFFFFSLSAPSLPFLALESFFVSRSPFPFSYLPSSVSHLPFWFLSLVRKEAVDLFETTANTERPQQSSVKNVFIRGSVVRYVHLPHSAVDVTLLEDATRRG
jgi:small nuclear ribonucleoprotein (snRNP)-like protein